LSFSSANNKTTLDNTNIILPQQLKSVDRVYQYSTTSVLTASGGATPNYVGQPIDCSTYKKVSGHVATSHTGTLYIQQSDDGFTNWLTVQTTAVSASTQTTIAGTAYYNAIQFDVNITSKWARIIYANGATAQTYFLLSVYATPQ
jgi:hypothetical protein